MPAVSKKQKNFFGAVKGAKKGQKDVSGKAKKASKEMTDDQVDDYLKEEDEEIKTPKTKERFRSSGKVDGRTKPHKVKKGKGSYKRDKKLNNENADIHAFIESIFLKKYSTANKYLNKAVESKIQARIKEELRTPLFE